MNAAVAWVCDARWRQVLLLIAVSAAIFLPNLGSTGLSMSEGHRAIPAWEMLADARSGDPHWLEPRMFGTTYLRKPPGMMWAIAASTTVFGETAFAARFPSALSATLLGLAVWWFATRWFGSPWGLAAGLAQVLLPVTWPSARSAEIESLHVLTTGLACLCALQMGVCRPRSAAAWAIAFGLALIAMFITKGPAGLPFALAAVFVLGTAEMPYRRLCLAAAAALLAVGLTAALVLRPYAQAPEPAIRQGVESFLWDPHKLPQIGTIGPVVLVTMLPASLAVLFPWGPDAARERETGRRDGATLCSPERVARRLASACVLAALLLTVFGVSNPRYGLPLCVLVTPLVAYVARGMASSAAQADSTTYGGFVGRRPAIARALLLRRPAVWPVLLLAAAAVYVGLLEPGRRASSGRDAGIALAADLPDGAEIWADELIEARPEVLYYAAREAARQGRQVRARWLKPGFLPEHHPDNLLLLLRDDALSDELARFSNSTQFNTMRELARGGVHKYTFVLLEAGSSE